MSKQTGLIRLQGKIGGISFYRLNGEDLARMANGPSKSRIESDPNFIRTRENNKEFGGSAQIGKAFRLAMEARMSKADASRIVSRVTKLFKEVNLRSPGPRGERSFELSANRTMLENFEFNSSVHLSSVFSGTYTATPSVDRNDATVTVVSFLPSTVLDAPSGATHFRMFSILGVVSDYVFDTDTREYAPADPALNTIYAVTETAVTALNATTPVTFTMNPTLPGAPVMTATVSGVLTLGVEFFQRVGTVDYPLAQNDCMRVIDVF